MNKQYHLLKISTLFGVQYRRYICPNQANMPVGITLEVFWKNYYRILDRRDRIIQEMIYLLDDLSRDLDSDKSGVKTIELIGALQVKCRLLNEIYHDVFLRMDRGLALRIPLGVEHYWHQSSEMSNEMTEEPYFFFMPGIWCYQCQTYFLSDEFFLEANCCQNCGLFYTPIVSLEGPTFIGFARPKNRKIPYLIELPVAFKREHRILGWGEHIHHPFGTNRKF